MNLTALPFLLYALPLILLVAAVVPSRFKPMVLAAAGIGVCAWHNWRGLLLSLAGVLIGWVLLRLLPKEGTNRPTLPLVAGVAIATLLPVAANLWGGWSLLLAIQALQTIECLTERARGRLPLPSLPQYLTYQYALMRLWAGPVLQWSAVQTIRRERNLRARNLRLPFLGASVGQVVFGIAKLVLLAQPMCDIWSLVQEKNAQGTLTALDAWFGLLACHLAITFGLCGAAELGQGLAGLLGYAYPDSFAAPTLSYTLRQYWSRFFCSVWQWVLRVFAVPDKTGGLYARGWRLPLAGACLGLCFGRGWAGLLWGALSGLLLVLTDRWSAGLQRALPPIVRLLLVNLLVLLGWGIAAQDSVSGLLAYLGALVGQNGFALQPALRYLLQTHWVYLVLGLLALFPIRKRLQALWARNKGIQAIGVVGIPLVQLCVLLLCFAELLQRASGNA